MYRQYRTRTSDQPLTTDQIRYLAPSAFATEKHHDRSMRYEYIPTSQVIEALQSEGFQPMRAMQARTRDEDRREHTKHMIVFRAPNTTGLDKVNDVATEVVLVNSHDGTSSYQLHAGIFRLICSNGLIVADSMLHSVRVPHFGKNIVGDVVEGTYEVVHALPEVIEQVEDWRGRLLTDEQQLAYARAALELRYDEDDHRPITPAQIVQPRRSADHTNDLFTTFNVVQENVMRGGLMGQTEKGKTSRTRGIKSVSETVRLNKALWVLTEEMNKLAK